MEDDRTPTLATEEAWILKYRAALNAEFVRQSRVTSIHKLLRKTIDQFVPASAWILHQYVRPPLEKAFAMIRKEVPHSY